MSTETDDHCGAHSLSSGCLDAPRAIQAWEVSAAFRYTEQIRKALGNELPAVALLAPFKPEAAWFVTEDWANSRSNRHNIVHHADVQILSLLQMCLEDTTGTLLRDSGHIVLSSISIHDIRVNEREDNYLSHAQDAVDFAQQHNLYPNITGVGRSLMLDLVRFHPMISEPNGIRQELQRLLPFIQDPDASTLYRYGKPSEELLLRSESAVRFGLPLIAQLLEIEGHVNKSSDPYTDRIATAVRLGLLRE